MDILAIVIASVVAMVIGALWYSPKLFGAVWMAETGVSLDKINESKKKGMMKEYIFNFVAILISVIILSWLMSVTGRESIGGGVTLAFLVWLGFTATVMIQPVLWEKKSMKLFWITTLHNLIAFIAAGIILGLM